MMLLLKVLLVSGCLSPALSAVAETLSSEPVPRVFLWNPKQLAATREKVRSGDTSLAPALRQLEQDADAALKAGPFSVTFKAQTAPSGDKHDYASQAPYFWPNPATSNGLPYVRHDGKRNPEINRISDHRSIGAMSESVETLALAFYFTGKEPYADKAAQLIRIWFLDEATRMNPNLEFAQGVPGIATGRSYGLIESRGLTRVVDATGLISGSKSWTRSDQHGLEEWFSRFMQWMRESKPGREESANKNNHGTYYDVQLTSFALFLGKPEVAKEILETAKTKRIELQIEPDGRQPLELARTNAWGYSVGNLNGLMSLADLGERVDVDLWNYRTPDGRGIRKALEYLWGFALDDQHWPYSSRPSRQSLFPLLRRAGLHYRDAAFQTILSKVPPVSEANRARLVSAD
jgi:hypothetical protein